MDIKKRRMIMKAFVTSQFSYCPLIWMFHSRALNKKINTIHERSHRITYNDRTSIFEELLRKDNSVTVHHRNLQVFSTKLYKVENNMDPEIVNEVFQKRTSSYNLRANSSFFTRPVHSVYNGTESRSFLGPKIWELEPEDAKQSKSLEVFKNKIKKWVPSRCPCRLCRVYLQNIGFI